MEHTRTRKRYVRSLCHISHRTNSSDAHCFFYSWRPQCACVNDDFSHFGTDNAHKCSDARREKNLSQAYISVFVISLSLSLSLIPIFILFLSRSHYNSINSHGILSPLSFSLLFTSFLGGYYACNKYMKGIAEGTLEGEAKSAHQAEAISQAWQKEGAESICTVMQLLNLLNFNTD